MTYGAGCIFSEEQLLGRSVVTKTFIVSKHVKQSIIVGTFIDISPVALEGLVFFYSSSFPWFMLLAINTVL